MQMSHTVLLSFFLLDAEEKKQKNEAILADLHDATPNPAFQFFYQKKKHA
jgi:hypothetical protein